MKITFTQVMRDVRDAKARTREQAIEQARRSVIEAKRRMCSRGQTSAYVDGHFEQPLQGRADHYSKG